MEATRLAAEPASRRPASALHRLQPQAMNYAWGKSCEESEVRGRARAWPGEQHSPRVRRAPTPRCRRCARSSPRPPPCLLAPLQVAQLVSASGLPVDPSKPYAELW